MILLKALHLAIRVVLVAACAFWALILVEVVPAFFITGINGLRDKLVHIWSMGKINLETPWSCQDSLQLVHEGYTDLLVLMFATWGLLEVKRFLDRRFFNLSRSEGVPQPQEADPESSS